MPKGPNRLVLDRYLDSAQEGTLTGSGSDWKKKAEALRVLADAMMAGAEQAELRIGEQTLTGPALRKGMEDSATSMADKSDQLGAAGDALVQVGTQIADTREARDSMRDLGEKPSPYQPPAGTPGVPLTADEINAQAAASQTRQGERNSWQDAFDKQEARALALTRQMDAAFLGAIPPMKAIHGQDDPTEPPTDVPSGPSGPLLPGTQVPTAGGGGGGGGTRDEGRLVGVLGPSDPKDHQDPGPKDEAPTNPIPSNPIPKDPTPANPTPQDPHLPPTTNVIGTSQTGVAYNPGGPTVSTPVSGSSSPGMSTGAAMGAAGMAGGAGAAGMAGAVRGGSAPAAPGRSASAPVRAIGSTGRSGSASALSRGAGAGSTAARPTAPGGASGTRAGAPGSAAGRGGPAGRGGAAGASGARAGAGGRSAAGSATGSAAGSAARSAAGGRGGRKGDRDRTADRDSLVYDQDWLGDDEVAPGVLD